MILDLSNTSIKRKINASTTLSETENKIFDFIAAWREENGYSTSKSDFIRQILHFTINRQFKRYDLAMPTETEIQNFINSQINQVNE